MNKPQIQNEHVTQATEEPLLGGLKFVQDSDLIRLKKLFQRTIGHGFKMAVVETPTLSDGDALLDWLRPQFEGTGATEHLIHLPTLLGPPDEEGHFQTNVWQALRETLPTSTVFGHRAVLVLRGIEDLQYADRKDRFDLLQQFNVQRDLFVRDYPCFWLLLVHPQSRQHWYRVAPDFVDFVAVWIEALKSDSVPVPSLGTDFGDYTTGTGSVGFASDRWPEPLRLAVEDINLSRFDEAIDRLHTFRAETTHSERDLAISLMLETDVWIVRGELQRAFDRLSSEVLPEFRRLKAELEIAETLDRVADILFLWGQLEESLRIRRETLLSYERLGDIRSRALTMGKLADVLHAQGELDEALRIRREEQLPVFERLGDIRSKAVTMGQIADVLQTRGELDEALRIRREEQLPVFDWLGDIRARAYTMGKIADVLQAKGELDEALRIRRDEQLPVFERLGDIHSKAATMGKIGDVLQARGELDEALRIRREEQLPVFERLGDIRSKAVTMGQIADVLQSRGELNEALRIRREEQLPVHERLGDLRATAVTLGRIADSLQALGEVDEALRIRRTKELPVYERLGDIREALLAKMKIAEMEPSPSFVQRKKRIELYRTELLPAAERLGDRRLLFWMRRQLAMHYLQRNEGADRRRAKEYLLEALKDADAMKLAEAKGVRQQLRQLG